MKWSIHAAVVLRVARFASMRTMLICGIRSIVLLRSMSPDRMSVATKPAIIPFSAFPIIRPDSTFLFDHLVGKSEQFFRNFDTKRLRGFEVDHELEFRWLQDCFPYIPRLRSVRLGGTVEGALLLQCERHNCLHAVSITLAGATKYVIGAVLLRAVSCLDHDQCRALAPRLA
jgi:hypothetical protein